MVTFVSLFLWLMTDVHPVQVAVDPTVVSVEIVLDGAIIGVARAPRWQIDCDFGEQIRPHELVAVGRDASGAEIGRATQLVNLPRPDAEVEIVLEDGPPEAPSFVRVITESSDRVEPLATVVTFDGRALQRGGDGRYPLPTYDPRLTHIISAESHFPEGISARRDITFGGGYGGRVTTELTAVPVVVDERQELEIGRVQGLLHARGEILRVAAVDHPGARIYMVRDHGAWPRLQDIGRVLDRGRNRSIRRDLLSGKPYMETMLKADDFDRIPPDHDRFYLAVPNPVVSRGISLYPIIVPFDIKQWGLPWLTTHVQSPLAAVPGQRLSQAVAVAGVRAASDGCPRAVVLVLGDDAVDYGDYSPPAVLEYLHALRVPFELWSTGHRKTPIPWGEASKVDDSADLGALSRRLLKNLRRQWIVWVEGLHLPNEIELDESVEGIRLAG
jgi:hypothetical protein